MAEAICEEYKSSLADLTFNSKPHINMLTMLAEENQQLAPQIVQVIESHLHKAKSSEKLPVLYLLDSIIKNIRASGYPALFTQNIVSTFCAVFEKVDEKTRQQLFKLRQTWNDIFSQKKLYAIDVRVNQMDPAWPITALPPQAIHVNPKFLSKPTEIDPLCQSAKEKQEAEMRQQLIAKQQELLRLQQQKLEMELLETKKKLEEQTKQLQAKDNANSTQLITTPSNTPPPVTSIPVTSSEISQSSSIPVLNSRDPRLGFRDPRVKNSRIPTLIGITGEVFPENMSSDFNSHISLQSLDSIMSVDQVSLSEEVNKEKTVMDPTLMIINQNISMKQETKKVSETIGANVLKDPSLEILNDKIVNIEQKDCTYNSDSKDNKVLPKIQENNKDSKEVSKDFNSKDNYINKGDKHKSLRSDKTDRLSSKQLSNRYSSVDRSFRDEHQSRERSERSKRGTKDYYKSSSKERTSKDRTSRERSLSTGSEDSKFKRKYVRNDSRRKSSPDKKNNRISQRNERSRSRSPLASKENIRSKNRSRVNNRDKYPEKSDVKIEEIKDVDERINFTKIPKMNIILMEENLTNSTEEKFISESFDQGSDSEGPANKKAKVDECEVESLFGSGKDQDYRRLDQYGYDEFHARSPAHSKWAVFKANHPETFPFSPRNSEESESNPFGFGLQDQDMRVGLPVPNENFSNEQISTPRNFRTGNNFTLRKLSVDSQNFDKTQREIKNQMIVNRLSHKFDRRQLHPLEVNANYDIALALSLKQQEDILKQAENQLLSGEMSHEQHQELLKQLHQIHQIQKLQQASPQSKQPLERYLQHSMSLRKTVHKKPNTELYNFKQKFDMENDKSNNFVRERRHGNLSGTKKITAFGEIPFSDSKDKVLLGRREPNNFEGIMDSLGESRVLPKDPLEISKDLKNSSKMQEHWEANSDSPDTILKQSTDSHGMAKGLFKNNQLLPDTLKDPDLRKDSPNEFSLYQSEKKREIQPDHRRNACPEQGVQETAMFGTHSINIRIQDESIREFEKSAEIRNQEVLKVRNREDFSLEMRMTHGDLKAIDHSGNQEQSRKMTDGREPCLNSQMDLNPHLELDRSCDVPRLRDTSVENFQSFRNPIPKGNLNTEIPRFYNPRMVDMQRPHIPFPTEQHPRMLESKFGRDMVRLLPPPLPPLPPPLPPVGRLRFPLMNKKVKLLPRPPPLIRTILIDNKPQEIRFYNDVGFIISDGKPYDVKFYGPVRNVVINRNSFPLAFGDCREVFVNGKPLLIKFGGPSRELIINGFSFELRFGAPPLDLMLNGIVYEIELPGPPPEVRISDRPREDINLQEILRVQKVDTGAGIFDSRHQLGLLSSKSEMVPFGNKSVSNLQTDKNSQNANNILESKENVNATQPLNILAAVINPDSNSKTNLEIDQKLNLNVNANLAPNNMNTISTSIKSGHEFNFNSSLPNSGMNVGVTPTTSADSINRNMNQPIVNTHLSSINLNPGTNIRIPEMLPGPAVTLSSLVPLNFNPSVPPPTSHNLFTQPPPTHLLPRPPVMNPLSQNSNLFPSMPNLQAQISTAQTSAAPINVNELLEKLFKVGILKKTESGGLSKISTLSRIETANKENEVEDIKFTIPEINFNPDELKVYHSGVIRRLYTGIQCQSCGVRFTAENIDKYAQHLDWHFRMNRREKDGAKKAFSRRWYYEMEGWIQFEEIEDLDEKARSSYFDLQADEDTTCATNQSADLLGCPVASGSDKDNICPICGEQFEPFWVEEEEAWHLKDAVRVDKVTYHPVCYEDAKESPLSDSEGVTSPVENVLTLSLEKKIIKTETPESTVDVKIESTNEQINENNTEEITTNVNVTEQTVDKPDKTEDKKLILNEEIPSSNTPPPEKAETNEEISASNTSVISIKSEPVSDLQLTDVSPDNPESESTPISIKSEDSVSDSCALDINNKIPVSSPAANEQPLEELEKNATVKEEPMETSS